MFERYTDQAKRAVLAAENEARALRHAQVGTEHLLLGLLDESDGPGVATAALDRLGIAPDAARQRVLASIYPDGQPPRAAQAAGEDPAAGTEIVPFTPRAMLAAELALREALRFGHNYVGTEHVLLGLIRERDGVAAWVLADMSGDLARVRRAVIQELRRREKENRDAESGTVPR